MIPKMLLLRIYRPYQSIANVTGLAMPLKVFNISVNEKEIHALPVGAVTITIESDTETDGEEAIVSESVPATCCMQINVVNDSVYGAPISSLIENQNAAINVQSIGSVMQPSEASQTQLHEEILVDDTSRTAAHEMTTQKYSLNLVRANELEIDQSGRAVPFICEESLNMECNGTSSSLVQQDIITLQGNSFPAQQMPVSAVTSIARNGLPGLEIPCYQADGRHTSSAEAHFSQRPLSAAQVDLFDLGVRDLGEQPLSSMYVGGNGTHVQDLRRRNDFLDFRSAATVSGSLNNRPLHDNPVAPEFPQPACADPLQAEMLKIEKGLRDDLERHEVLISHIKSQREKELEEVSMKYDTLLQDDERIFLQKSKDQLTNLNKVRANKLLAKAVFLSFKQATGLHANQFIQQADQQTLQVPASRLGPCVTRPLVTSSVEMISRSPAVHSSSNVVPCTRPMTCSPINFQNGVVLRASAPSSRSYSSTWTSDFPIAYYGIPLSYNSLPLESGHGSLVESQNRDWGNQGHVNSN